MKDIIKGFVLLVIHKKKLCTPFHSKENGERLVDDELIMVEKGFCPLLMKAHNYFMKG